MAFFEVLHCITTVTYMTKKRHVDKQGNLHINEIENTRTIKPGFYGVEDVHIGDVIEIKDDRLAEKASQNDWLKKVEKPENKKKVSKKK